ncbi:T6SS immunity protein Tdi1 domain-containing protein [Pseudoalteromonas luteoviolacea]|uniref:Uncharacterized protein n=1 Tax=Pseudoalteromonas luteoviolacea DSM 6061 TaxID=1365250 RepID=A0A167A0Z0_9GAMM|nr:T6SS immunity protein Tdi1 domain-containing protein [Pseudoalteromonas luteoviolacea]KZN44876.1 hypothetical protein N475_25850 [Pseudoalteromonas luteoviolacea DSM 6061]MBE0384831.1 hypothetical protein [Pseudoalteromonas luteoviolacea DSM 6061]MBE0389468.1 hypothetical protein [Pseudoalteromonas luteoviolacea DSM 6061]
MVFDDYYKIDSYVGEDNSALDYLDSPSKPNSGVYNGGLITIFNDSYAKKIDLGSWDCLNDKRFIPFSITAFGDLFLLETKTEQVSLFEPQFNRLTPIEINLKEFFDGFLTNQDIINDLLKEHYMLQVQSVCEKLEFGCCYILKPWLLSGGTDKPEKYEIGDFATYFDLVSQAY